MVVEVFALHRLVGPILANFGEDYPPPRMIQRARSVVLLSQCASTTPHVDAHKKSSPAQDERSHLLDDQ